MSDQDKHDTSVENTSLNPSDESPKHSRKRKKHSETPSTPISPETEAAAPETPSYSTTAPTPSRPSRRERRGNAGKGTISKKVGNYQMGALLGTGIIGKSFSALDMTTGDPVVIKELNMHLIPAAMVKPIRLDFERLKALAHPNLVVLKDLLYQEKSLYLVMEYLEGAKSVSTLLHERGTCSEDIAAKCMTQIIGCIEYLHKQSLVFGALRASNILVMPTGECKLCHIDVLMNAPGFNSRVLHGSPCYCSPEVASFNPFTAASDIWAVGCLCVEILTGVPPYSSSSSPIKVLSKVLRSSPPPFPETISEHAQQFLQSCFVKDPVSRPTATDLLNSKWISKFEASDKSKQSISSLLAKEPSSAEIECKKQTPGNLASLVNIAVVPGEKSSEEEDIAAATRSIEELKGGIKNFSSPDITGEMVLSLLTNAAKSQTQLLSLVSTLQQDAFEAKHQLAVIGADSGRQDSELRNYQQTLADLTGKYKILTANLDKLQNHFLQMGKEGVEKLALTLYGKISVDALTGATLGGFLEQYIESGRKWKKRWCILRDNFIFTFKSYKSNEPIKDIVYIAENVAMAGENGTKKYCFRVGSQLFSSDTEDVLNHWVTAVNSSVRWYERKEDELVKIKQLSQKMTRVPPPYSPPAPPQKTPKKENKPEKEERMPMFGLPLDLLAKREMTTVPLIVERLVQYLLEHGTLEEGILRVPGSKTEMSSLRDLFETTPWELDFSKHDIHAVAGLLKAFFRELPEPIIPSELNSHCADVLADLRAKGLKDSSLVTPLSKVIREQLPEVNLAVMRRLCELMAAIERNSAINKMSIDNLLTCLVPSLRCIPGIFLLAVQHFDKFFSTASE